MELELFPQFPTLPPAPPPHHKQHPVKQCLTEIGRKLSKKRHFMNMFYENTFRPLKDVEFANVENILHSCLKDI